MSKITSIIKRFIPIVIILAMMAVVYFSGLTDYVDFEMLKMHRQRLNSYVQKHSILAPLLFTLIYFIAVAVSFPGAIFLTILGGFLFAQPLSTLYVVVGATCGATVIFLAAKTALGDFLRKKAGPLMQKLEKGFKENATSYLFFLRLVPIFPFWVVNLAPAFFGVGLGTFVWTTFVGIIPGTFVFTQAGYGLGAILDEKGDFSLQTVFNWQVRVALIALGFFALLPILIKRIRNHHRQNKNSNDQDPNKPKP